MILGRVFDNYRATWNIRVFSEQRVQITAARFRVPDLCILRRSDPKDPLVRVASLLCIEILSKDDFLSELQNRMNDYAVVGATSAARISTTPPTPSVSCVQL